MKETDRTALVNNQGWKDFREWVKASVKYEQRFVEEELESPLLEKCQGRRDAFEDVWGMIRAFESPTEGEEE